MKSRYVRYFCFAIKIIEIIIFSALIAIVMFRLKKLLMIRYKVDGEYRLKKSHALLLSGSYFNPALNK